MVGFGSVSTDLLVQVLVGLVVYAGTLTFAVRSDSAVTRESVRWASAVAAFALIVAAAVLATVARAFILAAVVAYLAVALVNRAVQDPPGRRLDRFFEPAAAELFDEVSLPRNVNTRLLARQAELARRQGRFAAASVRVALVVRRELTGELMYDLTKSYVYCVPEAAEIPLRIRILPRLPHRPDCGSTVSSPVRTDPNLDKWTISYWPTIDEATWLRVMPSLQLAVSLRKSRDPLFHVDPSLTRVESVDSSARLTQLEFRCSLQLTPEVDTVRITLHGVPHLGTSPSLHFYAWDVCEGNFDFRAQLDQSLVDENRIAVIYPITSAHIPVEVEHGRDYAEARFRPGNLIIEPDDAVVIHIQKC